MKRTSPWRNKAKRQIEETGNRLLSQSPSADLKWLRTEISKKYPFGPRENHPYQVWLEELTNYLRIVEWERSTPTPISQQSSNSNKKSRSMPVAEGQLNLFDFGGGQ